MARSLVTLGSVVTLVVAIGCSSASRPADPEPEPPPSASVWSIDLVRTLPGGQADYVRSIGTNWASARKLGVDRGALRSYQAFVAAPDSSRGWDVLLMTEYADSATFAQREAIFEEIFDSREFVRVEPGRPSAEMRVIEIGSVAMKAFVTTPRPAEP
jgi:hypothetical protein